MAKKRKAAPKKRAARQQRPTALDMVREAAQNEVRHLSTRDIERNVDRMQAELNITNETIEDLTGQLSALKRSRASVSAQIEGMLIVGLSRK